MRTVWHADGAERAVTSPLSVVISAFAPVTDVRRVLTPDPGDVADGVDLAPRGRRRGDGGRRAQDVDADDGVVVLIEDGPLGGVVDGDPTLGREGASGSRRGRFECRQGRGSHRILRPRASVRNIAERDDASVSAACEDATAVPARNSKRIA